MKSKFLLWFTEQYRHKPLTIRQVKILQQQVEVGHRAERLLIEDLDYHRIQDAALKGWCAYGFSVKEAVR